MSPSSLLSMLIMAGGLLSGIVFILAFRFAVKEAATGSADPDDVPEASVHRVRLFSGNPWHRGVLRERLGRWRIRSVHLVQGGLVAMGITSVFIMLLCTVGIFVAMLVSSL